MSFSSGTTPLKTEQPPTLSQRLRRPSSGVNYPITPTSSSSPKASSFDINNSNNSKFSSGEIIDLMEKEQDAIVLKLMREINQLKEENALLKLQLDNPNVDYLSRSSSTISSATFGSSSRRFSNVLVDSNDSIANESKPLPSRKRLNSNNSLIRHRLSDSSMTNQFNNYRLDNSTNNLSTNTITTPRVEAINFTDTHPEKKESSSSSSSSRLANEHYQQDVFDS